MLAALQEQMATSLQFHRQVNNQKIGNSAGDIAPQ